MTAAELQDLVDSTADLLGLSREVLRAQVNAESSWRVDVVSHAGAVGLLQVLPSTAKWLADSGALDRLVDLPRGRTVDEWETALHDPSLNVLIGAAYLVQQIEKFGDLRLALAAYNAGPGRVSREQRGHGWTWEAVRPHLPRETRDYVDRILDRVQGDQRGGWLGGALVLGAIVAGAFAFLRD